jgi:uncharacterized Zn finger protein (UPF0148 family)
MSLPEGENRLQSFVNLVQCPVCGCLEKKGTSKCPECGTFHSGAVMEERKPPTPQELEQYSSPVIDPLNYSIRPNQSLPEEEFEESKDVRNWEGGNTDFSFEDDDDNSIPHRQIENVIPSDELIIDD